MLVINLAVMRRAFEPLIELGETMEVVDPLRPGARVPVDTRFSELARVGAAFNDMVGRLERERLQSASRELRAHEMERRRIAAELHDEVGQELTALMLLVDRAAVDDDRANLDEAREAAREALATVRAVVHELRPDPLEELGLLPALRSLADRLGRHTGAEITLELPDRVPELDADTRLVIYRVAQESLTNAIRHAPGAPIVLAVHESAAGLVLRVADAGPGRTWPWDEASGAGVRGMRERALLVGASLRFEDADPGVEVRLDVPLAR
jgi:two-component system sensor histidine kinase UhpB